MEAQDIYKLVLILGGVFWVAIPFVLNQFMLILNIPTRPGLYTEDWLSFWGGYLGGSLSAMVGMGAILASLIQNRKHHDETLRLSVLPVLGMRCKFSNDFDKYKSWDCINLTDKNEQTRKYYQSNRLVSIANTCESCHVILTNVGMSTAFQIFLKCENEKFSFSSLSKDRSIEFFILLNKNQSPLFTFEYRDLMNKTYKQEIEIDTSEWKNDDDFHERALSFLTLS